MDNTLTHYGILGMKWGVRRSEAQLARARGSKKKEEVEPHEDYKKAHDKANVKTMSDKELRERLNRLNMEKQLKQLSNEDVSKGKAFIDKSIKTATTVAAVTGTALTLYNNADKIAKIVKPAIDNAVRISRSKAWNIGVL